MDFEVKELNCYGCKIDLLDLIGGVLFCDMLLKINENLAIGDNLNCYKQYGFYFIVDNCIGCYVCEVVCSEKNGNLVYISFCLVGYVEGGIYFDYKCMNIFMVCNYCDDLVCLKGCFICVYIKYIEYGVVLQDLDICFGCGYCIWVCFYNVSQFDFIQGQVFKCNMCVDCLEEGFKLVCVFVCLGNVLNFGVIENLFENCEQILLQIFGFFDFVIINLNICFQ